MTLVVAIHGILSGNTPQCWPGQLAAWYASQDATVQVITERYFEGPFPRWNWVKNRFVASRLAKRIESVLSDGAMGGRRVRAPGLQDKVWFVAHSNGACIALLAARALMESPKSKVQSPKPGTSLLTSAAAIVAGMILTGAACEADVVRNGVLGWVRAGQLGKAIAYSSEDDAVVAGNPAVAPWYWKVRDFVWGKMMWPYGCLGRTGWMFQGRPANDTNRIFTRWFPLYESKVQNPRSKVPWGHSAYFQPENLAGTFEQIAYDLGSET